MNLSEHKKYTVTVACEVTCYAQVEVEAESQEAAERIVDESIDRDRWDSPYWDAPFEPEWADAENLRVI